MQRISGGFVLTLKFNRTGLWFYHFRFLGKNDEWGNAHVRFFGRGDLRLGILCDTPESWQITVFSQEYQTPNWIKGGIMYQIFPDRFCKCGELPIEEGKILRSDWGGIPYYKPNYYGKVLNNDFFGGNLNGICEKLDYLKSLHVSVVYLNPIFKAYSNHRYDTGDYMKIDPLLGSEADFDRLVEEGKKRGIRIILDGVFNHTGDDSRYFNKYGRYKEELGAHQSPDSQYADWYHFTQYPDSYDSWWGIDTLPAINERSESYQRFILGKDGVLEHWLTHG
ncbi:MAG: glycoside hydrolase family 13 protein, partial [Clostridia bacterium]|nr:glycoside hydrolase family 13 protein [Clostridia bacterium]